MSVLIVIPARLKATRLPGKPLAEIGGLPMVVQVMRRAEESGVGQVVVACDGLEIAEAVTKAGGTAVLTDPEHPSGSDRIWEAVRKVEASSASFLIPSPLRGRLGGGGHAKSRCAEQPPHPTFPRKGGRLF